VIFLVTIKLRYVSSVKILITGNCQVVAVAKSLAYLHPTAAISAFAETQFHEPDFRERFLAASASADYVIGMPGSSLRHALPDISTETKAREIEIPPVVFRGFHPDCVYAFNSDDSVVSSVAPYHSAILLWAYKHKKSQLQAQSLFRDDVFAALGYYKTYDLEIAALVDSFSQTGINTRRWWQKLRRLGVFMHTINHPRAIVLASLAVEISESLQLPDKRDVALERYVQDEWLAGYVWPIYPDIAKVLGTSGSYTFRLGTINFDDLASYVEASWDAYSRVDFETLRCPRIYEERFSDILQSAL